MTPRPTTAAVVRGVLVIVMVIGTLVLVILGLTGAVSATVALVAALILAVYCFCNITWKFLWTLIRGLLEHETTGVSR